MRVEPERRRFPLLGDAQRAGNVTSWRKKAPETDFYVMKVNPFRPVSTPESPSQQRNANGAGT